MRWGMTNLGEGVARNWHYSGLVVLVGDACHKFTPNAGQGFNTGLQDVVALCNLLRGALVAAAAAAAKKPDQPDQRHHHHDDQEASGQEQREAKPGYRASLPAAAAAAAAAAATFTGEPAATPGQAPTPTLTPPPPPLLPQPALEALFREYHASRRDEAESMQQMSASYTRIQAVASLKWRLLGWLLGGEAVQGLLVRWLIAPQLARSLVLDYVPFEDRYVGSVPWVMTCTEA
ncbi:kynurenine 3-monooxygenase [Microdochium nivale]|nr:kynurenine 3-monooxygenase [Microdochium nivale]